jgi:hypothetical protein
MEGRGKIMMIGPEKYYSKEDEPNLKIRKNMWDKIQKGIHPVEHTLFMIPDRKSFLYGIAASIVIYLSSVGVYHLISDIEERSQPMVIRLDEAYISAISEFERVMPVITTTKVQSSQSLDQINGRKEQLKLLDEAIEKLRRETNHRDISPLKCSRLRNLYSIKLQILQKMIEQGDIEL